VNFVEQSPSRESKQSSDSQGIRRILWHPDIHCRIYKSKLLVPVLIQINPVHAFSYKFFRMHFNIILQSSPMSSKWSLSLRFPHQTPPCTYLLNIACAWLWSVADSFISNYVLHVHNYVLESTFW